uniref:NADH-ubiquinone oxidoreductase chain 5 n=1 Tax=Trioza anthrisci TaxID=2023874 RepID=A0A344A2T0_9HEMI|nr:NADH dehydrogenase subunit 5 [Trioza anthrisci]AWU49071.1 NADH dehydrogenase subunit 5 [Trioza anthrisci]
MKNLSKFEFLSFLLFKSCLISLLLSFLFLNKNMIYLYEIELLMVNSIMFNFIVYLDWMSLLFMFIVLFISCLILIYSKVYMGVECHRFLWLTVLFVFFMIIMILSPSSLGVLLGWDGLGIISYCLVIYYKSSDAYNSGFITASTNRFGDSMLLLSIVWFSMNGVFIFYEVKLAVFFFILACMTKSAQFPFNAWLPSAMAAPTPISSLVHSSTLVTAGVYLMIRFFNCYNHSMLLCLLLVSSLMTILIAGSAALNEFDLKRVIALSTLSQLGFMMLILCVGYPCIAFFHLLIHALFKALLFMCAGSIIHSSKGIQDLRKMGNSALDLLTKNCMCISLFNLMGMPFSSGFYSKDSLVELLYLNYSGIGIGFVLLLMILMTAAYSIRFIIFLSSGGWIFYLNSSFKLTFTICLLGIVNIFMGCFLNWMIQELDFVCMSKLIKMSPLMMILLGMCWHGVFIKNKKTEYFMLSMFYISTLTKMLSKMILLFMIIMKMMDQGWFESMIYNLKLVSMSNSSFLKKSSSSLTFSSLGVVLVMILMI